MPITITEVATADLRFPTSQRLDGSDAMNPDPDYSAAYLIVRTDFAGLEGHAFVFTIGRGNELQTHAVRIVALALEGRELEPILDDMGGFWRQLVHDSQLRWLGPEKGVMHMAIGAVVNAMWDLKARLAGEPLWLLLARMSPEELVSLVDFRYLTDALTRAEALAILRDAETGRSQRIEFLLENGYPAYTTTPGWLGYSDDKLERLVRQAVADGFGQIKLKVGADLADDLRRLEIARRAAGPDFPIAVDANQRWDVSEAIDWITALAPYRPHWIEEPTSPDDILGHASIRRAVRPLAIATGEHVANRVVFKQLLQADAIDVVQIDATRVAGVNENIAILLLAAKFGRPVCPHAGGVGLCEVVSHLSMFDFVAVSRSMHGRAIEYVDHLHEHCVVPADVRQGRYYVPTAPGSSAELHADSRKAHTFPGGSAWATAR